MAEMLSSGKAAEGGDNGGSSGAHQVHPNAGIKEHGMRGSGPPAAAGLEKSKEVQHPSSTAPAHTGAVHRSGGGVELAGTSTFQLATPDRLLHNPPTTPASHHQQHAAADAAHTPSLEADFQPTLIWGISEAQQEQGEGRQPGTQHNPHPHGMPTFLLLSVGQAASVQAQGHGALQAHGTAGGMVEGGERTGAAVREAEVQVSGVMGDGDERSGSEGEKGEEAPKPRALPPHFAAAGSPARGFQQHGSSAGQALPSQQALLAQEVASEAGRGNNTKGYAPLTVYGEAKGTEMELSAADLPTHPQGRSHAQSQAGSDPSGAMPTAFPGHDEEAGVMQEGVQVRQHVFEQAAYFGGDLWGGSLAGSGALREGAEPDDVASPVEEGGGGVAGKRGDGLEGGEGAQGDREAGSDWGWEVGEGRRGGNGVGAAAGEPEQQERAGELRYKHLCVGGC